MGTNLEAGRLAGSEIENAVSKLENESNPLLLAAYWLLKKRLGSRSLLSL